jgi:hypothetical protein
MPELSVVPDHDESPRCTDFARSLRVDPGGSAIRADLLIAAEAPLPWPKPVFSHQLLSGIEQVTRDATQPTRVLAAVPSTDDVLHVVAFRRARSGVDRQLWRTDAAGLRETVLSVIDGDDPAGADPVAATASAEVWICTQGSHDICCGADGMRLASEVEDRWADVTVRRVSHTGGHRFAPTAITLPDGRMWAHLVADDLHSILTRTGDAAELMHRCRGWWGAESGPEQMAERCVLEIEGWAWESAPRSVDLIRVEGDVSVVRVSVGEGATRTWTIRVQISREVPTITCRAPGGLPTKPGTEYRVLDIRPA